MAGITPHPPPLMPERKKYLTLMLRLLIKNIGIN